MKPVCNGISVSHDNPHEGQYIREYPAATFRQMMTLLQQGWPQLMQDVRLPDKVPDTLYLGRTASQPLHRETRHCGFHLTEHRPPH